MQCTGAPSGRNHSLWRMFRGIFSKYNGLKRRTSHKAASIPRLNKSGFFLVRLHKRSRVLNTGNNIGKYGEKNKRKLSKYWYRNVKKR